MADDYKVGYRRPPKASQFKKGQSGNPLGSSRKARTRKHRQSLLFDDFVLEGSQKSLSMREGDRTSTVTLEKALIAKQLAAGLNGNRLERKAALELINTARQNKLAEVLDNYTTYRDYQDNFPARVKLCRARGLPPPLPHPDDLHFDQRTGQLSLTGPRTPEELAQLEKILKAKKVFTKKLEEHRADADEGARLGASYLPSDFKIIKLFEEYLSSWDNILNERGWLPRVAGQKDT